MSTEIFGSTAFGSTASEKATANEKAVAHNSAAVEGAQSVADAVKRVADAAVAAAHRVEPSIPTDFHFSGTSGGRFTIDGAGFGASGTVKIGQLQLFTREWSTTRIVGDLPANAPKGEVTVHVDDKIVRRGLYK